MALATASPDAFLMYDALAARFYETRLAWNPENPLTGRNASITSLEAENYIDR